MLAVAEVVVPEDDVSQIPQKDAMTLQVIGAGLGRTGTYSMKAALEERKCFRFWTTELSR
jgi:hypothetical protein